MCLTTSGDTFQLSSLSIRLHPKKQKNNE